MPRTKIVALSGAVVALSLALAACSSSSSGGGSSSSAPVSSASSSASATTAPSSSSSSSAALSGSITVLAASSLTGSFKTIGADFQKANPGTTVKFSYGGSSALATQINNGAPADVFASAAPANMTTVVKAGNVTGAPSDFASNTLEIAVAPGNPMKVTGIDDLAKSSLKVALCQPQVPCGATAQQAFTKAKITVKPVTLEPDVKSTLGKVTSGDADAGVVYVTDVQAAGKTVTGVKIPAAVNATTEYPIATLKASKNATLAQAFVTYVKSSAGQQVLATAGFAKAS